MKPPLSALFVRLAAVIAATGLVACRETAPTAAEAPEKTAPAHASPVAHGQRVLTCGNSFHAWFVAPILADIAQSAGLPEHQIVAESKIGGSRAIDHWNVPDDQNQAKAALRTGRVDVLTLACMLEPDEGIELFAALGLQHNPAFRVSLQEFWIPWDKREWPFTGDEQAVDPDAATVASLTALHEPYFKAMDDHVRALNTRLGKQAVFVAPVGQAVLALRAKIIAGEVPGLAKQADLFTDKLGHPRPPVEALVAYVHFAVIYRRSPVGLPMPAALKNAANPVWDEKLNRLLQELAWDAAKRHPLSGV